MTEKINIGTFRQPQYDVDRLFLDRWSPRAMSGEEIPAKELMTLFEAARWAPSSYNAQPWRFIYARRNTEHWNRLFGLLGDYNKTWAKNAAALVVMISKKTFEHNGKPSRTHSFDTGAAWASLALQGSLKGFVVHGMAGFDYDAARTVLSVPGDFNVEAMCAVGRPGNKESLSPEMQELEQPSGRKDVVAIVFEGTFNS